MLSKGSNLLFTRLHTPSSLRSLMFCCSVAPKLLMSKQIPYILLRSIPNLGNLAALMRFSPFYFLSISSGETSESPYFRHVTGALPPVVHTSTFIKTPVWRSSKSTDCCALCSQTDTFLQLILYLALTADQQSLSGGKLNKTQYLITVRFSPSLDPHST